MNSGLRVQAGVQVKAQVVHTLGVENKQARCR